MAFYPAKHLIEGTGVAECVPTAAAFSSFAGSTRKWGGNGEIARKSGLAGKSADDWSSIANGGGSGWGDPSAWAQSAPDDGQSMADATQLSQLLSSTDTKTKGMVDVPKVLAPSKPPVAPLSKPPVKTSTAVALFALAAIVGVMILRNRG